MANIPGAGQSALPPSAPLGGKALWTLARRPALVLAIVLWVKKRAATRESQTSQDEAMQPRKRRGCYIVKNGIVPGWLFPAAVTLATVPLSPDVMVFTTTLGWRALVMREGAVSRPRCCRPRWGTCSRSS